MRPVERGEVPVDPITGLPKVFACYEDARGDLLNRLGCFCSYCEMRIENAPNVEHIAPKSRDTERERDWDNLLLSCNHCNPTKGKALRRLEEHLWPHLDNTARAFRYDEGGRMHVADWLAADVRRRALRTRNMIGLDPREMTPAALRRRGHRRDAWTIAVTNRERLRVAPSDALRETIVELARSRGYWSVWMTVFADDPDMRRRLIAGFKGTAAGCFDANAAALPRAGGAL